jgi:hypothetical protein
MTRSIRNKARILWAGWVRLARAVGEFQARVLLTLLYIVVLLPFGICVRLFGDPLRIRKRPTKWSNSAQQGVDFTWAVKQ